MTCKSCSSICKADSSCALKYLNNNLFALNLYDTALSYCAVIKADINNFLVGNAFYSVKNYE